MKTTYVNAHGQCHVSVGSKQEGLEDVVLQGNSGAISIMKTWWGDW